MNKNRVDKAIRYLNNHKAKKCIIESKTVVLKDLNVADRPFSTKISGSTCTFMKAICNRFQAGFFLQEYIEILNSLTADYTEKQIKFYDWV